MTRMATLTRRPPPILSHFEATRVPMTMSNPGTQWARRLTQVRASTQAEPTPDQSQDSPWPAHVVRPR